MKDRLHRKGKPVPNLPPALGVCEACAKQTPVRVEPYLVVYCAHNRAGGFYSEATRIWTIFSPIEIGDLYLAIGFASAVSTDTPAETPPVGEQRH
jgi:hypothetical protein